MSTVPFPPEMGYQPGMGPLHPARSPARWTPAERAKRSEAI